MKNMSMVQVNIHEDHPEKEFDGMFHNVDIIYYSKFAIKRSLFST